MLGNNGIIAKAKEAKTKSAEADENDLKGMNALIDEMNNALGENKNETKVKPQIGDYVNYTYDVVSSGYTTPSTENGDSDQTIAQDTEKLKWQILNIDESNGTIDLVSEKPTSNRVTFQGILGYNNGPYIMNKICEVLYSNNSLGIKARSINLLDMEKHLTATGINERNKTTINGIKYGTTKTYNVSNSWYPSLYAGQKGAGVNVAEENAGTIAQPDITKGNDPYEENKAIATTEPTTDDTSEIAKPLTVTPTFYEIAINSTNYGEAANVLSSSYYWVASRCIFTDVDSARFGLRYADVNMYGTFMFYSDNSMHSNTIGLRPVVSISSSILSDTKDASKVWNLTK